MDFNWIDAFQSISYPETYIKAFKLLHLMIAVDACIIQNIINHFCQQITTFDLVWLRGKTRCPNICYHHEHGPVSIHVDGRPVSLRLYITTCIAILNYVEYCVVHNILISVISFHISQLSSFYGLVLFYSGDTLCNKPYKLGTYVLVTY